MRPKYLDLIKPSTTMQLAAKARELTSQGISLFNMNIGEPDFDTPENVKNAAHDAIKSGKTKYTPVDGIPQLKQAILTKYRSRYPGIKLDNIIVSAGAKQVLYNFMMSTLDEGDEAIIPSPYWVSYPDMVKIARAVPIIVEGSTQHDLKLTPDLLDQAITEKTKWVLLNTPNNPSGMKYSRNELKAIVEVVKRYPKLHVLSDDIYEDITYDGDVFSLIDIAPEIADRIFVVHGVSKSYAMTGWRIGYGIGNEKIIKDMVMVQSQSTSGPSSISQYAAVEALNNGQAFIDSSLVSYERRRNLAYRLFSAIQGLTCIKPQGAFYLFPNCEYYFNKKDTKGNIIRNDNDFCAYLLNEAKVVVVPGSSFGMEGFFRLSYVTSEEVIEKGAASVAKALKQLS